jgi:DNA-binding transcriptional MerR regulator
MKTFWTAPQLAKIVGVSYDTINYWSHIGLVTPSIKQGKPKSRSHYSFADIVTAAAIKSLRNQGISLQVMREANIELNQKIGTSMELGLRGGVIVADNKNLLAVLYTLDDAVQIMSLLRGGQLLLPLDQIVDDLQEKIDRLYGLKLQTDLPSRIESPKFKVDHASL